MRTALLASTAGLGAAFSVNQVKEYADGYTRFTNQLKVAGLEGAALGKTQNDLYGIAQRYGVQLESVGGLYGRLTQGAKELGASQSDLLRFVGGVGAALKVQGGDAASTSGAILQLTQALGGQIVRAEEFNSINEGARPILQAVANGIDRFGGSVAKLRGEVIEGKVTSREFFEAFLKGSAQLEAQASKANFTISASFQILNNALGKYIGESDQAFSASERVGGAIVSIANNLDTIVPALTTIAIAYGATKAAGLAFGGVASVIATVAQADRALAEQVLLGNASFVSRSELAANSARLVAATDAEAVASIEATIAARQAEQATPREQIAAERALAAERRAQAVNLAAQNVGGGNRTALLAAQRKAENDASFATQRLTTARQRLAVVDAELAVAESSVAGAHEKAAASAAIAEAATARATIAARAGAAASRLFAGALTLIGGSVAGGAAVLAIGALVGAVLMYRNAMQAAEDRNRATAAAMKETSEASVTLNQDLRLMAQAGASAASGLTQVGANAASSTGQMLTFAGAVGEAAEKLRQLAIARRNEQVLDLATKSVAAERRANEAQARINARRPSITAVSGGSAMSVGGPGELSAADRQANANDARIVSENRALQQANYRLAQRAANLPLAGRIRESDRVGGRDVDGDLARVTRDLVVARERGIRSQIDALEAQKFELTQYKKYRKDGLSPQAASDAASGDAASFRNASSGAQGDRDARTNRTARNKADREALAASKRQAAEVRDAAADTRAFAAGERQANNDIAAARAELTNSAVERAAIEKARIESERQSRNEELAEQAKQGRFGDGDTGQQRLKTLQGLNDQRAALETQVVDARERQRIADEALALANADRTNQTDLLRAQSNLVTSASERRDLERRILAIQYDEERAKLDGVIASRETTDAEKEIARRRKAMLGDLQAADEKNVDRQNAGPLDQYRQRIQAATGDMKEALESVEVNGLESLESGLASIISGTEDVGSAFKKMAQSIIADLVRIGIQKAILSAIGGSPFGFRDGGSLSSVPGRADGGSLGGLISGPGNGRSDSILALLGGPGGGAVRLSNREFIMNERAVQYYGADTMAAINGRRLPRFADGGSLSAPSMPGNLSVARAPSLASLASDGTAGANGNVTVSIALSDDLDARIDNRAAGVAVQVVRNNAPQIVEAATVATVATLNRSSL
ncbi:tape measure protein [Sphingomonas sanguinis]|uniref:tape measure protein n=1 Tax=Sphingomonas sp. LC-1 TaxID=3110957 RepID=UPI0021BAA2FB|nr:tape measure protein [Sphingomonas sp. LC-1]MCT8002990.1 tape measure protein [Sphingomonas sp. LC-1]